MFPNRPMRPCYGRAAIKRSNQYKAPADLRLTFRILEASKVLQLQLIDHVIISSPAPGRSGYFSFKEGGVI
jgi:DNA repair protein RadC